MAQHLQPAHPILIVDDERAVLDGFEIALHSSRFNNIETCDDSRKVLSILKRKKFDLVLLDLIMPYISGEKLISKIKKAFPNLPVIIVTAVADIETVVHCMHNGAVDYILKPVDVIQLRNCVRKALEYRELQEENILLSNHLLNDCLKYPEYFSKIITQNSKMRAIFQYCESVARSTHAIIVTGETGTGKELIAKAVHDLSERPGAFVAVNIAAYDDPVVADTLFGHVKGAFTGADKARTGLVEKADGGTLFLDEIGDLSMTSQVKLLRLLQEKEYSPVGSDTVKNANIRVVASTHRDLDKLRQQGNFRDDLYYRLVSHHIRLPPLRDRLGDIQMLLDYFLEQEAKALGKNKPTYHPELLKLLGTYKFPGNIRELKAVVGDAVANHQSKMLSSTVFRERLSTKCIPEITQTNQSVHQDFYKSINITADELPFLKDAIRDLTQNLIKAAMKNADGNQTVAARILGISQQSLSHKIGLMKQHSDKSIQQGS